MNGKSIAYNVATYLYEDVCPPAHHENRYMTGDFYDWLVADLLDDLGKSWEP
jgi:hypothetical protein